MASKWYWLLAVAWISLNSMRFLLHRTCQRKFTYQKKSSPGIYSLAFLPTKVYQCKGLILDGVHLAVSPGRVSLHCNLPKFVRIHPIDWLCSLRIHTGIKQSLSPICKESHHFKSYRWPSAPDQSTPWRSYQEIVL